MSGIKIIHIIIYAHFILLDINKKIKSLAGIQVVRSKLWGKFLKHTKKRIWTMLPHSYCTILLYKISVTR